MEQIGKIVREQNENVKSSNLPERQVWLERCKGNILEKYGDAKEFAIKFNPDLQMSCAMNVERSLTGSAPTLRQLEYTYGLKTLRAWLSIQFENLNKFVGVANKMSVEQMRELANIFFVKAPYLKASEMLLFFYKFKSGDLGDFYGSVDPHKLSKAFNDFLVWRGVELDKIHQRQREQELERKRKEWLRTGITREEYEKNKQKAGKKEQRAG